MQKRETMSVSLDKEILSKLKYKCMEDCTNCSRLTEKLIKEYLNKNGKKR